MLRGGRAIREEEIREEEEKEELPLDRFMQALPNLVGVFSHSRLIKITITMIRSMLIQAQVHFIRLRNYL